MFVFFKVVFKVTASVADIICITQIALNRSLFTNSKRFSEGRSAFRDVNRNIFLSIISTDFANILNKVLCSVVLSVGVKKL